MEWRENIYVNNCKMNTANNVGFTSTCLDTCNQDGNAWIPQSLNGQTVSQESDRLSKLCKGVMGLLCVILLACLIALIVKYRADTNQLQTDYYKCINDKDNLTIERDHLENSEKSLIKKNQQLEKLILNIGYTTGWRNFLNHLYSVSAKELTWDESKYSCVEKGAYLVIINSKEEQEFVSKLKTSTWIGLTDSQSEGVWKWVDNTEPIYKYWMTGEPNNILGNENCVEMINMTSQQNWNDLLCDEKRYYICEYD